jgi:hypothetical protein
MSRLEVKLEACAIEIRKILSPREIIGLGEVGDINVRETGEVEAEVWPREHTYGGLSDRGFLDPGRCQSLYCNGSDLRQGQWLQIVGQTTFGIFSRFPMPVSFRTILARPLPNLSDDDKLYEDPGFRVCVLR